MTSSSLQSDPIVYTQQLRQLMQAVGIDSFRVLAEQSQLSRRAVDTIRQGKAETLKYQDLLRLSQVLKISLSELMASFSRLPSSLPDVSQPSMTTDEIRAEYQLLKQQLEQQRQLLRSEFQQESFQILESLLVQLPTAIYAAQTNAEMTARSLLPLLRPIDRLLKNWGITAIGEVGAEIAFDPYKHQLTDGTQTETETPVIVRYVGYEQGEKLLYKASVRPKT